MARPTLALPIHEQPRKKVGGPPKLERVPTPPQIKESIRTALRTFRKEPPRPKLSIPPTASEMEPNRSASAKYSSKLPLQEKNGAASALSPRSQWVANVTQLKQHQGGSKSSAAVPSSPNATPVSWNELEAKLSKRMREPSPRDRNQPSATKPLSRTPTAPGTSSIPRLVIPKDDDRVHAKRPAKTPNQETTKKAPRKTSKRTKDPPLVLPASKECSSESARRKTKSLQDYDNEPPAAEGGEQPSPTELTPMTSTFQRPVAPPPPPPPPPPPTLHWNDPPPPPPPQHTVAQDAPPMPVSEVVVTPRAVPNEHAFGGGQEAHASRDPQKTIRSKTPRHPQQQQQQHDDEELHIDQQAQLLEQHERNLQKQQQQFSLETRANFLSAVAQPNNSQVQADHGGREPPLPDSRQTPSLVALKKSRQTATTPSKAKGKLSWLRMALTPSSAASRQHTPQQQQRTLSRAASSGTTKSSKSSSDPMASNNIANDPVPQLEAPPVRPLRYTTPLQLLLWLSAVKKAIEEARPKPSAAEAAAPQPVPPANGEPAGKAPPRSHSHDSKEANQKSEAQKATTKVPDSGVPVEGTEQHPNYYHHTQDVGVYVDYSTFDDGESVSSIELLFQWLTCRELSDAKKRQPSSAASMMNRTVVATDSAFSDDLSMDMSVKPQRRTIFSR
jgi:hypothetical protein